MGSFLMPVSSVVCKVLKGLFVMGWLCAAAPDVTLAVTRYIDGGCANNGTGLLCSGETTPRCATSNGACGAYNSWLNAVNATWSSGDIIEARGAHSSASHTTGAACAASFNTNGVYRNDRIMIRNKSNFTLQSYLYGQVGQESPVIETASTVTWNSCVGDVTTPCTGLPGPTSEFYYYTDNVSNVGTFAAISNRGRPTFRVGSKAAMTNATAGYISGGCSNLSGVACQVDGDCPSGGTCIDGDLPEIDSFNGGTYLLVRYGTQPPNGTVYFDNNGNGFDVATGSGMTIRGFTSRSTGAFVVNGTDSGGVPPTNVTVSDNKILYASNDGGSGYQLAFYGVTPLTITDNYMMGSLDEAIHTDARDDVGAMVMTITGNFIRDTGNQNILGSSGVSGCTCEGMTLSSGLSQAHTGPGDYSGSLIANNYVLRTGKQGIIFENNFHGTAGNVVTIRDNIINTTVRSGFKFACDGETTGAEVGHLNVYNNLLVGVNTGAGDSAFNFSNSPASCSIPPCCIVDDINIYNNTSYTTTAGGAINVPSNAAYTDVIFRNNLLSTGTRQAVTFADTDSSNLFEYNFVQTSNGTAVSWTPSGGARACSALSSAGTGNINDCPNPNFVSPGANDFHINPFASGALSKAIDTGTTSLAARVASINNTVAEQHGFPSGVLDGNKDYSNAFPVGGGTVDIGATELMISDGGFETNTLGSPNWQTTGGCGCDVGAIVATIAADPRGGYSGRAPYDSCVDGAASPCKGLYVTATNLTVGQTYRVTGLYYVDTSGESYWEILQHGVTSANPSCDFNLTSSTCAIHREIPAAVGAWLSFDAIFYAESTSHNLRFRPHHSTTSGLIYWDNITVRPN